MEKTMRMRTYVLREILKTEKDYVETLDFLVHVSLTYIVINMTQKTQSLLSFVHNIFLACESAKLRCSSKQAEFIDKLICSLSKRLCFFKNCSNLLTIKQKKT